jgi:hypothetical protein
LCGCLEVSVRERVVDGLAVPEGHDAEPASQGRNIPPEPDATIGLYAPVCGSTEDGLDPLASEVGAFPHDLFFEVTRRSHPPTVRRIAV